MRNTKPYFPAVIGLLLLVACGTKPLTQVAPRPTPSASPSPSPSPSPPLPSDSPVPPPGPGPLPGQTLPMSGPLAYPLLIQIENTAPARPQAGLQAASVVFQYLTEGGITRFSALYHRVPGIVGPVRSARFISIYIYERFGAYLMASGGAAATYDKIAESGINAIINDFDHGQHFIRWNGRIAPHNLYTQQPQMLAAASVGARPARTSDLLRSAKWAGTEPAPTIALPDLKSTYNYVAGQGYQVISDGAEEQDVIFGPVRATSVVVLHVNQFTSTKAHDVNGTFVRDFDFTQPGPAEFYANGTVIRGKWSANGRDGVIELHDASGAPLGVPPGLTWVSIANP